MNEIKQKIYIDNLNPEKIAILCRNNKPLQALEDYISSENSKPNNSKIVNYTSNFQKEKQNDNNNIDKN